MNEQSLWTAFATGDERARNALIAKHLSLVHHVARQLARTLPAETNLDELVSSGSLGLMNAIDAFDVSRGLAFSTFAVPRVRGEILDDLRRQDHVPRSVRRKPRDIARARETLMRTLGRPPEHCELAESLNVDVGTLWRWQSDLESAVHVALDRGAADGGDTSASPAESIADDDQESAEDRLTHAQEGVLLRKAIMQLKEKERTVLSLYYFEELKLHEIATILALTESRVSQIRSRAVARLRTTLAPMRQCA